MISVIFCKNNTGATTNGIQREGILEFTQRVKSAAELVVRHRNDLKITAVYPAYYAESRKEEPREGCVVLVDVSNSLALAKFAEVMINTAAQGKIWTAVSLLPLAKGFEPGRSVCGKVADNHELLQETLKLHRKQKEIFASSREQDNTAVVLYQAEDGVYLAANSLPGEDADEWQQKISGLAVALGLTLPVKDAGVALFRPQL